LLAKGAFFVLFFSCLLLAKEACLFEAILININKQNNKNEARAKEIKKTKNAPFAPPLACKGSIFVFLTRASGSASKRQFLLILIKIIIKTRHEQRLKNKKCFLCKQGEALEGEVAIFVFNPLPSTSPCFAGEVAGP
jgi:hypothetical protein